jgi:hypothetical protein
MRLTINELSALSKGKYFLFKKKTKGNISKSQKRAKIAHIDDEIKASSIDKDNRSIQEIPKLWYHHQRPHAKETFKNLPNETIDIISKDITTIPQSKRRDYHSKFYHRQTDQRNEHSPYPH